MAGAFQLLRSNALIWSRIVRDYLKGERAPMTDLAAWNADANCLPTACIRSIYVNCSSNTISSKAATKPTGNPTLYLAGLGIRIVGTDAWSWDPPRMSQMKKIEEPIDYAHQSCDQLTNSPCREHTTFTRREGGVEPVGADKMSYGRSDIADWFAERPGGRLA